MFRGSPPQVRGKQSDVGVALYATRITPAGAGKTVPTRPLRSAFSDHPRRCGENYPLPGFILSFLGSPPQVRGKLAGKLFMQRLDRITPAGAGKTRPQRQAQRQRRDHPRRCGENCTRCTPMQTCRGSPPQVRGKLSTMMAWTDEDRITPAGAGKTLKRSFRNQSFCS